MNDYDSDSSNGDDIETDVLLGYASKASTSDEFSRLGGSPTWLDDITTPSGTYAKCKVCNGLMNLLIQLHGDLPERYPDHERRLYIWACRRKACRRKDGSVRALRAVRASKIEQKQVAPRQESVQKSINAIQTVQPVRSGLGEALFGTKSPSTANANPFAIPSSGTSNTPANPFAAPAASSSPTATTQPSAQSSTLPSTSESPLNETFAQKVRLSSPISDDKTQQSISSDAPPLEPWPAQSSFPAVYPSSYIDAEKEYLDASRNEIPSNARLDPNMDIEPGSSSGGGEGKVKDIFESSMDKTFQKFADRLAQNPDQILRYEFGGAPLLYSRSDTIGKLLAPAEEVGSGKISTVVKKVAGNDGIEILKKVPKCGHCGAGRVFEMQLTPNAIAELEAEDMSLDGMDWGTIIFAVCSKDCTTKVIDVGEVGYIEEWVGVQWEEVEVRKK